MTTRTDRNQTYDLDGNVIAEEVVEVDITEEVHRSTLDQAVADAITDLLALAEYPALPSVPDSTLPTIPAGTLTTAALSDAVRLLRAECLTLRQVIVALRNEAQATRAGAQQVAETLANKVRLDRGDFAHLDD